MKKTYPNLEYLLAEGAIFIDQGEYVGIAYDDVEVHLGIVGEEDIIEAYLADHPTPMEW